MGTETWTGLLTTGEMCRVVTTEAVTGAAGIVGQVGGLRPSQSLARTLEGGQTQPKKADHMRNVGCVHLSAAISPHDNREETMTQSVSLNSSSSVTRLLFGFIAGFVATLIFHQIGCFCSTSSV